MPSLPRRSPSGFSVDDSSDYRMCEVQVTDAALVPIWYRLPATCRQWIRQVVLAYGEYLEPASPPGSAENAPAAPKTPAPVLPFRRRAKR